MRNMWLVAKREFLEQIRSKSFRITTFGLPLLFAVIVVIVGSATAGVSGTNRRLVIASSNVALANAIEAQLEPGATGRQNVKILAPATPEQRAALINQVRERKIDGLLVVATPEGAPPLASYFSASSGDFLTIRSLKEALDKGLLDEQLLSTGLSNRAAAAVLKGIPIATYQVKPNGPPVPSNAEASFWKGYVMAILLSLTTMLYGLNVARSIIQEKTSRIFEVMLATVKPTDMLAGKLIGVGAVGLVQIAIWVFASVAILATPFAAVMMTGQYAVHFTWIEGVLFPAYFLLGYLLYSSLFAGLAATCETEQELQMYMPLAAVPTWLSLGLIFVVINNSNSPWAIAGSLFPPTAPVVMFLRMASEMPPAWQLGLSLGLMVVSIMATLWFASRLYRVGILMYGKRATIPELVRWLRYS